MTVAARAWPALTGGVCAQVAFSFLLVLADGAHAQTPRLQGQGSAASGQANAFAAQADDPSAIHYNPAGMTQLPGVQTLFGTLLIGGTTSFSSPAGARTTGDRNASLAWPPPNHAYVTVNLGALGLRAMTRWTLGLGVISPFGSLTRYPTDNPFKTTVTFTTLPLVDVKPTVAYRLSEDLSIGAGVDIYTFSPLFGEGHAEQQAAWPGGKGIPAGSQVELNGRDTALGYNVAVLYTALRNAAGQPLMNVGLVYRSAATLHLAGEFRANGTLVSDATARLPLPQVFTAAIAIWPLRQADREWKWEFDVDYVDWTANQNLDVRLSNGTTLPQPLNWRGAYTVMVGTEYRWLQLGALPDWEIALRAGYQQQQSQVPASTFNPGVPSANTHIPSFGIGVLCRGGGWLFGMLPCGRLGIGPLKITAVGMDVSYQAAFYETRSITGHLHPGVNGTYHTLIHAGGVSLRVNY